MMVAEASILVDSPIDHLREIVLDPQAYAAADTKVRGITVEERTADGLVARIDGSLGPFRSFIRARYTVAPERIDLDMLEGRMRHFHAVFLLEPGPTAVRLTHREEYDFGYGALSPLVEWALRGWAQRSVEAEVRALKRAAEAAAPAAPTAGPTPG